MISVGTIWERTVAVIAGRFAILAAIALLLLFAPPVVQAAVAAAGAPSPALKFVAGIVSLGVFLAAIVGALAITAIATDPAVDRARALAIGRRRIGAMLAVMAVLLVAVFASTIPGALLLGSAGFDVDRARAGLRQEALDAGRAGLAFVYFLLLGIVWLWLGARLVPLLGVIVNERRGLGAIRRSLVLTRGATLKLIGVLILYSIVLLVVLLASTSIVGLIVRLIVGADGAGIVAFVTALVTAAVTAGFSVLQAVFSGQFYLAARGVRDPI